MIGPPIVAEGLRRDFGGAPVLAGARPHGRRRRAGGRCWARTAPARRRCCACSPRCSARAAAALRLFGEDASRRPPGLATAARARRPRERLLSGSHRRENLAVLRASCFGSPDARGPHRRAAALDRPRRRRAPAGARATRAAWRSAWRWRARCCTGRSCCCSTSRSAGSIPTARRASRRCSPSCGVSGHAIVLSTHDVERVAARRDAGGHPAPRPHRVDAGGAADAVVLAAAYDTVVTGRADACAPRWRS